MAVDGKSGLYLNNVELNYSDGLDGKGFTWTNLNIGRSCGCGSSFSV